MNKELVEKVRRNFDLNIYETKVWLALLEKGNANIAQIHELSKVPRSRVYDVLKSLETKGFCVERIGRPIKYIAVEPPLVVEKIKKSIEAEAQEKVKILEKVKVSEEYKQLENLHKTTVNVTEKVGTTIRGRSNLLAHLTNASKNAQDKIIIVSTPRGLERKLAMLLSTLASKAKRGVKTTVGIADSDGERFPEELRNKLKASDIKVKPIDGEARFCIVDNNVFLISESGETRDDTALWFQSNFFADTLAGLLRK